MLSKNDPAHNKRLKQVSYKLNIPEDVIELALHYSSEYIKNKIAEPETDVENLISEEEFDKKYPIIKIPYLGYLKPNYFKYKAIQTKQKSKRNKLKKE
jgi:hypothetical protein